MSKHQFSFGLTLLQSALSKVIVFFKGKLQLFFKKRVKIAVGKQSGFTLVELLVVIAIIGLLIGLLLPAVQAAREAASRMRCANRVKQLALGLHGYHDTHNTFPCGGMNYGGTTSVRVGVFVALLPYVEQEPLYDAYLAKIEELDPTLQHTFYSGNVNDISDHHIDTFVCPSDPGSKAPRLGDYGRPNSYRFNFGDWPTHSQSGDGRQRIFNPRGLFSLRHNQSQAIAAIKDGTSNTIALSEGAIGYNEDAGNMDVKGNLKINLTKMGKPATDPGTTAFTTSPSTEFDLNLCWETNKTQKRYLTNSDIVRGNMGRSWGDSLPYRTGFMTIFSPNTGPNCRADTGAFDAAISVISASSYHPTGVQCGLADGAVRFIPNKIHNLSDGTPKDYKNPTGKTSLIVSSGASPFGIWGALGSINGGESVTVP
jgi:prepilin-type N-terminal cleavage/methylation domain-containing protein